MVLTRSDENAIYDLDASTLREKKISDIHNRVKIGIARTFQNIRLFKRMTVLENVKVSSNIHMNYGILAGIFKTKKYWEQEDKATKEALENCPVEAIKEINE